MRFEPGHLPARAAGPPAAHIDLGPIVQALERQLGGEAPTERIEALLRDLLDTEFRDARVTAFLPIFLHRMALEALRHERPSRPRSLP
jgi:hypothetical protein